MNATEHALKEKYNLIPDLYRRSDDYHDRICGYNALLSETRERYSDVAPAEIDLNDHYHMFRGSLDEKSRSDLLNHFGDSSDVPTTLETAVAFIESIVTPEIDAALHSYFGGHYAVLWYNWAVVEGPDTPKSTANKWHCDAGPTTHLKTITYFDYTEDHGSSTSLADISSTQRLKEVGYLLNDIKYRQIDISDLLNFYDINLKKESPVFSAGDTVMFNPTKRMHQIILPKEGMKRRCFTLCYIPSPLPWKELMKHGFNPQQGGRSFEQSAKEILKISEGIDQNKSQSANDDSDFITSAPAKVNTDTIIEMDVRGTINSSYSLLHHLVKIFKDEQYAKSLHGKILANGATVINFTVDELLVKLKESFQKDLNWSGMFKPEDLRNLEGLIKFEKNYYHSFTRYYKKEKPEPNAIMWPNPAHEKYPQSRFEMTPFVTEHKIMDMNTPVASAGSCFAFEIAHVMQEQKYNYLVEERADSPEVDGIIVDGYSAGDKYAHFSANYGILFNTPSLLQLAQKAFGLRHFEKYCCRLENGMYMDPYRENVFFVNRDCYIRDYPKHIAAVRRVLSKVKVMIFTAGLNECWQLDDGTVLSRNPRSGFYHLLKHRVLTVEENIASFSEFVEIMRRFNPDFKLVISLSPVPLLATGRGETHHILDANTHSKSVLKVAIDHVVNKYDNVYYLPSYELVKECSRDPWEADDRHVTRDTVERVLGMFRHIFVEQ